MGLRINTNVPSISARRALERTNRGLNNNFRKLASGLRITRAGDDAAGLAISENLRGDIRSFRQAKRNANDGISLIQTGEGSLGEISNILIRLRELAIQAASDTIGDQERNYSNIEFQQLKEEIDRIAKGTEFNGVKILDGTQEQLEFQIGINNEPELDRLVFDPSLTNATIHALGIEDETIASKKNAQNVIPSVDDALVQLNKMRANLGALQSRLVSTVQNLAITNENLSEAKSRIVDVDIASESSELAKNSILQRAGISVLAQANSIPQIAIGLITKI